MKRIFLFFVFFVCAHFSAYAESPSVAAKEWRSYIEPLLPIGERMVEQMSDPDDPQLRQEMYRHIFSMLTQAYFGLVYASAEHPDFWPHQNSAFTLLAPNPDGTYYLTPIDDDGVYKISGIVGNVRVFSISLGSGTVFTRGEGDNGPALADYGPSKLKHIKKDGSFEVILSKRRPDDYKGDWLPIESGATYILVRQFAYDWANERDWRIAIDRLDYDIPKPRLNASEIQRRLMELSGWAERNARWSTSIFNSYRDKGLINKVYVHDYDDAGGHTDQKYIDGIFELTSDEALILEVDVPDCHYWSFQLTDQMYGTMDHINRQTSLNGHMARLDADGKFRAVITAKDPHVPNWLDTAGYKRGGILGRWMECDDTPVPTVKKVAHEEVRRHLPDETPFVSAEERERELRLRKKSAQLRRRW